MNTKQSPRSVAAFILCSLTLVGCSTPTTVSLKGTPGTQVSGRYRASHASSDFAGAAAWQMDFGRQRLEEFEFRKATLSHSVDLDIRRGSTSLVHATAEPGTIGLRARKENGWKVETLK